MKRECLDSSVLARGGISTTLPLADKHVETWIFQFIPRHVRMYVESFVLYPTYTIIPQYTK